MSVVVAPVWSTTDPVTAEASAVSVRLGKYPGMHEAAGPLP